MMSDLFLKDYNLNIIDFNELFTDSIQHDIIDALYEFDLLDKSINNSSVKKFLLHYIILNICDKILNAKSKSLIFFNFTQLEDCELKKYYSENELLNFLNLNLRIIEKLLPIKIFISKYSLEYINHLVDIDDGKAYTTINSMVSKINSIDISKFTFSNIKKFTKRYELTFLNRDYFNRLSTKLLLIR